MDSLTLGNYRCFHKKQTVRLAPLTLLVGENSTGKTSFLAMIKILRDFARGLESLDFKKDPYDLGSFDEIAHYRGGRGGRATEFEAGFLTNKFIQEDTGLEPVELSFEVTFGERATSPIPVRIRVVHGDTSIEVTLRNDNLLITVGTYRGTWQCLLSSEQGNTLLIDGNLMFGLPLFVLISTLLDDTEAQGSAFTPVSGAPKFSQADRHLVRRLASTRFWVRTFASAPVRSKPRRTYDPASLAEDPEGDHIPMLLAATHSGDKQSWQRLKEGLEKFGESAGLFDEISIRQLGKRGSDPFQVQIRKFGKPAKGPPRNLIDVGYGVSQVLPVVTGLLQEDAPSEDVPSMFLWQQPEVHLHPSAQAALGTLFCEIASYKRQLIIETHSDYLIDRVRMDVRDGVGRLGPKDVSILFFERENLGVKIHQLGIDKDANLVTISEDGSVLGTPQHYKDFFMEETSRFLGL